MQTFRAKKQSPRVLGSIPSLATTLKTRSVHHGCTKTERYEPPHIGIFVGGVGGADRARGVDVDLLRRRFSGSLLPRGTGGARGRDRAREEAPVVSLPLSVRIEIEAKRRGISFYQAAAVLGRRGATVRNSRRRAKLAQLTRLRESWAWQRDFE